GDGRNAARHLHQDRQGGCFLDLQTSHFASRTSTFEVRSSVAHSPWRISGSTAPSAVTPSTSISGDPIIRSTCTPLRLPPARSNSSSPIVSPLRSVNLYADPMATWLAAF